MCAVSTRIAVAAPDRPSADAALRVVEQGGGAVDAAVAAMLVTMVCEVGIVSLLGGLYATVWGANEAEAVTVDGCVAMPGIDPGAAPDPVRWEVDTGYGGGLTMTIGHGSVATPGAPAALGLLQERFGRLPWREVVEPAEEVARSGFELGQASGHYLPFVRASVFGWDPQTVAGLRGSDGGWVETGGLMVSPDLADTLGLLAREGPAAIYRGDLARAIVADMAERGGLVTAADLSAYSPVVRPALAWSAGRWQLRTNPPPAIGGATLAGMMIILGDRPTGPWTHADVEALVGAQRTVLDVRHDRIDVAGDRDSAVREMLAGVGLGGERAPSTAHVSVVDSDGTACALTASHGYGSGATVPGTGLWLNNCLGEHELNRAAVAPGEILASNMAPSVGRRDDGAVLAIGSPGADRITTALLQVLAGFVHAGTSLQAAVDRPRLHVRHLDSLDGPEVRVEVEDDLPLPPLDLPVRTHPTRSMYFGGVAATLRHPDGSVEAAGDPRRTGVVAVGPARTDA
jgi:gamma-glutamyltranspeptidase / glutathione hydrolase